MDQRHSVQLNDALPRKRLALAAFAGVAIVVGSTIWYVVYHDRRSTTAKLQTATQDARQATADGNYKAAYTELKKNEAYAKTKEQKVEFYGTLAAMAANAGKVNEAIDYYALRHKLDPGTAAKDAELLADLYERSGDIFHAVEQYKLARQYLLDTAAPGVARDARIKTYDAIIDNLEYAP